ncbi:MAG: hypothetical protein KA319_04365 [Ferruginibacter sp.]|nr:hypothetical protein [Ferruginibacter sp.]
MKPHLRYIFYFVGLLTILACHLLWISMPFSSLIILGVGFLISVVSIIVIVLKDRLKLIIFFLLIGVTTIYFRPTFKEWAIARHYNSILTKNEKLFEKVNAIISSKKENFIYDSKQHYNNSIFSIPEIDILNQFLNETKVIFIRKDREKIFYPIWGVPLEMDYGIFYFYSSDIPQKRFRHLKEKWYYY